MSGRILAAAAVGVALILLIVVIVTNMQTAPPPSATSTEGQGGNESSGNIDVDSTPDTSDELRLTELKAVSSSDSPSVGDTVTVSYSLTNVGDKPIRLAFTFVGVRDPDGENRDTEDMNEERVLPPGETLNAQGRRQLDAAGSWEFWPCYQLSDGGECPDKWRVIFVFAK
jgi:hypothetical protein